MHSSPMTNASYKTRGYRCEGRPRVALREIPAERGLVLETSPDNSQGVRHLGVLFPIRVPPSLLPGGGADDGSIRARESAELVAGGKAGVLTASPGRDSLRIDAGAHPDFWLEITCMDMKR